MGIQFILILSTGVVSGLITTLLIFIGVKYWRSVIVPWYENRVYKDIRIDGEWEAFGEEQGEKFSEIAKVNQNAHRVWGDIIYRTNEEFIQYQFEGEFKNLILTARYWVRSENNLDRGTFTLMLRNNGRMLKGFYAWYLDEKNDVIDGWYEWKKRTYLAQPGSGRDAEKGGANLA